MKKKILLKKTIWFTKKKKFSWNNKTKKDLNTKIFKYKKKKRKLFFVFFGVTKNLLKKKTQFNKISLDFKHCVLFSCVYADGKKCQETERLFRL